MCVCVYLIALIHFEHWLYVTLLVRRVLDLVVLNDIGRLRVVGIVIGMCYRCDIWFDDSFEEGYYLSKFGHEFASEMERKIVLRLLVCLSGCVGA